MFICEEEPARERTGHPTSYAKVKKNEGACTS